jgi:hypothetical protein
MAKMTLREYANKWLKDKGTSASEAKKDAGKYKSISAAKKAGSLYYTNKDGKTMLAVYAEDLKDKGPLRPKLRPKTEKKTGTPTKRLDTKGDTPAKKKAMPVEDLTFTVTAAVDGKSGVQAYINKLEKQLTELRAAAEAKRKRNVVPRTEEAKIRSIEGSIKRIKEKQGMSKGGMARKKKTGMAYGGMAKKKMGMNQGGMANCGASMKPNRMSRS